MACIAAAIGSHKANNALSEEIGRFVGIEIKFLAGTATNGLVPPIIRSIPIVRRDAQ